MGASQVDGATRHLVDRPTSPAAADRAAIRDMLVRKGFEHATATVAHGIAVELVDDVGQDVDARLAQMAGRAEVAVLDALVYFARQNGWKGAR